jgi:GAF domain-containing protein
MRRRSKASGEPAKTRRRRTVKRRNAAKVVVGRGSSAFSQETKVTALTRERDEALEQLSAASQVLNVISSSPGDLQPVFEAILENATRICEAKFGNLALFDGQQLRMVAMHRAPKAFEELRRRDPVIPLSGTPLARLFEIKRTIQIADLAAEELYASSAVARLAGGRSFIGVPMLKQDNLIGAIAIYRQEVRPFTKKQVALLTNFAAQAVIAIENTRLLNELRESLEQQTATSDVLRVISTSPGDLQPVFQAMLENAVHICEAKFGNMYLVEGDGFRLATAYNTPPALVAERTREAFHPGANTMFGEVARTKQFVHVADLVKWQAYRERDPVSISALQLGGMRTILMVPMLKENELVGVLSIYRQEVLPFTDKHIALVQNFAAQAVIAIENTRLLNELRQRTADLSESLEQQTATSEVLGVISSSPGELETVFRAMLENATRICEAKFGTLMLCEGETFRVVALHNAPKAYAELRQREPVIRPGPQTALGRLRETKQTAHIQDITLEAGASIRLGELGGARSVINVPMLKDDVLVGVIVIYRQEVRPFSAKQVALLTNFATQAVIAIENARLLNELRQSLEQQTATSDVLKVVSSSQGELESVFSSILDNATRICEAIFGNLWLYENHCFRAAAVKSTQVFTDHLRREFPIIDLRQNPGIPLDRVAQTRQIVHVGDLRDDPSYKGDKNAAIIALVERVGARTFISVPMLKEGELLGAINLYRQEVRPFTDKQIALVANFAAQAVIAIENARLLHGLNRLNQQLEQRVADQVGEIERMGKLRRFLPPQVADLIVASGTEKQLESHRREITALFCDLRGFTGFSESSDPEDVMALLRDYHAAIGQIIIKYSGTLERYAGDGVMVVFNDPVPVENPALQAVLMALEMRDAIGALTQTWHRWGHDIGFGIGIAHGFATLGTIGFEGRFDYAAIGTVSNVASRLCDEAKPGQILISPRVLTKVENAVTVEPVGEFALKGIRRPMMAYNVLESSPSKLN